MKMESKCIIFQVHLIVMNRISVRQTEKKGDLDGNQFVINRLNVIYTCSRVPQNRTDECE